MSRWARYVKKSSAITLATRLTKAALEKAIATRQPAPGLVHHSDRGLQYASDEYVRVLKNTE